MPKDTTTNKEKKTMWSRFTSWLATTWLGRAWNTVKSWFSSNGATKAGAADQSKSETLNNDTGIPVPGLDKKQEPRAAQVQNPDQNVSNGLSATDTPAAGGPAPQNGTEAPKVPVKPAPSNGTPATPLSGPAEPATGGESDMQETKQNPVKPNPTPLIQPQAPKVEKLSGKITVHADGKIDVGLKLNLGGHENFDTLKEWKNSANPEEFCAFMERKGEILYITGRYSSRVEVSGNVVDINSVGIPGTKTVYGINDLKEMKNLVGLNKTTEIDVEISNVPFEAPEVKSSKTTENGSEIKKESEAKESANVVDTGSTQGNPQPQPQPQPQGQGGSKGGTGTAESEAAPAPTSLVTEGNPQPEVSGAATVKSESEVKASLSGDTEEKEHTEDGPKAASSEPKGAPETPEDQDNVQQAKGAGTVVDGKDSSPKAAESSTEQPAATGGQFEDVTDTSEQQSEGEDVKGGQEHRLETPEDKEDKTSLSGVKQEHEVLENHVKPQSKVSEDHKDGTGAASPTASVTTEDKPEDEKSANGKEPRSKTDGLKSEHVPSTNGKPRTSSLQ